MARSKSGRGGSELHRMTDSVTLAKAFQLAHSLYRFRKRDRQIALTIVAKALSGVQVRLVAQLEADRRDPQKPTKVRWSTHQWLQLLIYCKSEQFERQQETDKTTSLFSEDMIIRYLKHLILTTSRRNSFHTCLGLTRLVYDYSAGETMAIYDLVFQDPDASTKKSDAYYRSRKNKLLEELARRFEPFIRIEQGLRGEKRFQSERESNRFAQLIVEYLTLFTPWDTSCELPPHLDAWATVHSLQFSQPAQIHSLIHPNCFARITRALKLGDPDRRLSLPRFFLGNEGSNKTTRPDDSAPSELTREEASEIQDSIAEQRLSRKKFVARSLSVLADGIERARLDLDESSRVRFDIEDDVNLIELVGKNENGELLLAAHLLTHEVGNIGEKRARKYSILLEGGQKISLVLRARDDVGDAAGFSIEIDYQETRVFSVISLWWRQVKYRLFEKRDRNRIGAPVPGFRFVLAVLALIAVAFTLYFSLRNESGERIAKHQPPSSIEPGKFPIPETTPPQTDPTAERKPSTAPGTPGESSPGDRPTPGQMTRDQTIRAGKSLLNIQRIYVESFGDDEFSLSLRQELSERLQAGNRFAVTRGPDEADTALSGSARRSGWRRDENTGQRAEVGSVTLRLLNISGNIMWSRTYRGTARQVATEFTRDLLSAIEAEHKKNE